MSGNNKIGANESQVKLVTEISYFFSRYAFVTRLNKLSNRMLK